MPKLTLYLLGPPRAECDGAPLEVDTRKAIALLAYLAAGDASSGYSRDSLASLFWPEVDQARAHAALRRTLSVLNKALGGRWLKIDREAVALVPDDTVWSDTARFQALLTECEHHGHPASEVCPACVPPLTQAVALYRDDFMAGFTLRDSPGFDDWQFFQAESLRRELATALERLAMAHSRQGNFEKAIAAARRWLALDPLHEPAHRHLMQLYTWSDQRAAALRQYRECVRVLEQELGVTPLEETTQLYQAIKENRAPGPPAWPTPEPRPVVGALPAPPAVATAGPHYPLVGRAKEWERLLAAYEPIAPGGRLIVLEGEAGIGKTRLAEAFLQQARSRGATTMVARCYEGEVNLAYGPFIESLRGLLGHESGARVRLAALDAHWLSEAARLWPELQGLRPEVLPAPPGDSPGAQGRFLEAVCQVLLAALGPAAPGGVLLVDDAHWLDAASLDLLTYLVRRLHRQALCLVVTWRGEQVPPGARLRLLLAEAQRAGLGLAITLGRLDQDAVVELAEAILTPNAAAAADPELLQRLYHETEGLPFFVVEYLAMLGQPPGAVTGRAWPLPSSVRNLLEMRLAQVSETGWQLLHTAAVIGRSFDFETLHGASGRSDDEAVSGLEALMAAGIVHEVDAASSGGEPTYDFSHEKLRTLVYEQTSLARRRLLHRRVAEALSARARRMSAIHPERPAQASTLASQVAQHYQLAGHETEAAEYFRQAGEHARALYANAEALSHFRSALALGHPQADALYEAIGDLQTLSGDYASALASYETAAAMRGPAEAGRATGLAGLEHKLGNVYHRCGDWELAESHFQAALSALGEAAQSAHRARVYADWSLTAHHRGETVRALQLAQQALALAEQARDRRALAQAHNILGILSSSQGDLDGARHHLERSLSLAEALGDPGARVAALNNLALAFGSHEQYEPALQLTRDALTLCAAQGDRHREAALHSNLADWLHATGQSAVALEHLKRSAALYAEIGVQGGNLQPEIWKLVEW